MSSKIKFLTFAGGAARFHRAAARIVSQAEETAVFDSIKLWEGKDLWNSFERGFGYWAWKPYIIKEVMDRSCEGDVLLYCDAGCEVDVRQRDALLEDVGKVGDVKLIDKRGKDNVLQRFKMDLVLKFPDEPSTYSNKVMRHAGAAMFSVCEETHAFVTDWLRYCQDRHLLDDSPSVAPNFSGFLGHRHDQSIWTLLRYAYDFPVDDRPWSIITKETGATWSSRHKNPAQKLPYIMCPGGARGRSILTQRTTT